MNSSISRISLLAGAALVASSLTSGANAQIYAVTVNNGNVLQIDPDAGTISSVASTGITSAGSAAHLNLHYAESYPDGSSIWRVDVDNPGDLKQFTRLYPAGTNNNMTADANGILWEIDRNQSALYPLVLDEVNEVVARGPVMNLPISFPQFGDIAWGPDGYLYIATNRTGAAGSGAGNYIWDPANPGSFVAQLDSLNGENNYNGLTWYEGKLYGSQQAANDTGILYELDPTTMAPMSGALATYANGRLNDLGSSAIAQSTCTPTSWDLRAGQTIDVGSVIVNNDADNLYVTYDLDYQDPDCQNVAVDAEFGTLHLWVGDDLLLLPVNNPGNPVIGQFPFQSGAKGLPSSDGLTNYTFTIPFADLGLNAGSLCDQTLHIVTHAEVNLLDCNGNPLPTGAETAFGGPDDGPTGNRWWYYGDYVVCCNTGQVTVNDCETAFAKGDYVWTTGRKSNPENLPSLDLTRNRWGWAINFDPATYAGPIVLDVWAAAGLNDTANGALAGTATIESTGVDTYEVTLNLVGYTAEEIHIYAGDTPPATIAPGQYGYTDYFDPAVSSTSASFQVSDTDGDGVWFVIHSVVCANTQ